MKETTVKSRKRPKPESSNDDSIVLTIAAKKLPPSERCWKCKGRGLKFQKLTQAYDGPPCKVCNGEGIRKRSKRSEDLAKAPGKILNLRGYPNDHPFRAIYPEGFAGPRAFWGGSCTANNGRDENHGRELPLHLRPSVGEVVGSLGCGDWRIYQIADGNKLTVDDFVCAWVAAEEMRKRGFGMELHRSNPEVKTTDDHGNFHGGGTTQKNGGKIFGGKVHSASNKDKTDGSCTFVSGGRDFFNHADIGTGCGSVLMMTAWAFLGNIRSIGIEAQEVSFRCLKRGLEWNLGSNGISPSDWIQIQHKDLRSWDGNGIRSHDGAEKSTNDKVHSDDDSLFPSLRPPYQLITGTPPYFPLDSFVASQNHEQKVRCRVPTRGGAPDYIEAASRFLLEENCNDEDIDRDHSADKTKATGKGALKENNKREGVFCMVEAAFDKAEAGVLQAANKFNMRVRRRVDVITRAGLPPRFSCWVMTKKRSPSAVKPVTGASETHKKYKAGESHETSCTRDETCQSQTQSFPIETFTLRNADLTRTAEYTRAMELMGWVDFEKSKTKGSKSLTEIN